MHGKGKSVVHSKSRTCSGRKTLKRCNNKGEVDNVVLIDVDSDNFHNVMILDIPESIKQKLQGSSVLRKDKKCVLGTIICIDEDESSETFSSRRFFPTSSHHQNSANAVGDDCQFVPESFSPLNLSKSKRTYSGKATNGNHYGDSDSSDCEFMEGSFGKLREQWEKANMKKKSDVQNGQFGRGDWVSTSELRNGTQHEVEVENMTNQHTEANFPISSNASYDEGIPARLSETDAENSGSKHQYEEQDGTFHAQDGDVANAVDGCIINERERLKETDEYKRAVEAEWSSRQRELQLQAEEAQKLRLLRKRMKAESMRIVDMERRQKQRVEEIREVQKQDEEKMNLKEQIRAEVRKELNKLESTCPNMAYLLRGLGIQVGGGFNCPPHEVRAAYKRALLRFHPDRASGSDIRQLVEAEEKFKLISRMREKFLS